MKLTPLVVQIWLPFAFSVVLCGIVILTGFGSKLGSVHPGFPAFFCFLPMAFFFVANATYTSFRALEKRIEELEKQLKQ